MLPLLVLLAQCRNEAEPEEKVITEWIGSESCQSCHQEEYDLWKGSHHYHAMHPATEEFVLGDFENKEFRADGVVHFMYRNGDEYWVEITDHGVNRDYKIEFTFGWTPLQQYLVQGKRGRLQTLRLSWDSDSSRWFHQHAGESIAPGEWFHWTGASMNWNTKCADCHSTNLSKNYFIEQDSFHTVYSEVNLGCESCHGPSGKHVAFHEGNAPQDMELRLGGGALMTEMMDACGPCHSRRSRLQIGSNFTGRFESEYRIQLAESPYYHLDGQILDEDYVMGSFMQSKMYHNEVKCTDCHDPHSYELKLEGDLLCGQCHEPEYASPGHHFHEEGSASCVDCHMTGEFYMGNDFRRDHSFRVPRPDHSLKYGTPNACESCHTDMNAAELASSIESWYGPERRPIPADGLLMASELDPDLSTKVMRFIRDLDQPEIVRASGMRYLLNTPFDSVYYFALEGLQDSSYLVRLAVLDAFLNADKSTRMEVALPLLDDEVRSVRIASARLLEDVELSEIYVDKQDPWRKAQKEYSEYLLANTDFREGQSLLAEHHFRKGNMAEARFWWERALQSDPNMFSPKFGLAIIYASLGELERSGELIRELLKMEPGDADLWYRLGLIYAEQENWKMSIDAFNRANRFGLESPALYANWGLALLKEENCELSLEVFKLGLAIYPDDEKLNQNRRYAQQYCGQR